MVLADFPIILWFRSGQYVCQRTWDRSPFALFSDDHKFLCILNEICLTCSVVQCLWKCTFTVQRSLVLLFCHYHFISRLLLLNRIFFLFPTHCQKFRYQRATEPCMAFRDGKCQKLSYVTRLYSVTFPDDSS